MTTTVLWSSNLGDVTNLNGVTIGQTTPEAGAFTTLVGTAVTATSVSVGSIPVATCKTLAAGTTGAGATAITTTITDVTTADSSHVYVILPTGVAGDARLVYNSGGGTSETITIYCQSTDTIDGGSAGGSVTVSAATRAAWFYCVATNTWISAIVGVAA